MKQFDDFKKKIEKAVKGGKKTGENLVILEPDDDHVCDHQEGDEMFEIDIKVAVKMGKNKDHMVLNATGTVGGRGCFIDSPGGMKHIENAFGRLREAMDGAEQQIREKHKKGGNGKGIGVMMDEFDLMLAKEFPDRPHSKMVCEKCHQATAPKDFDTLEKVCRGCGK